MSKTKYAFVVAMVIIPSLASADIDPTKIPLGDGKLSTAPTRGSIMSCNGTSWDPNMGGASSSVPWISTSTWDSTTKVTAMGTNTWPRAQYSTNTFFGGLRSFTGNGLPVTSPTGNFPISTGDPAYQYDHNPNSIQEQKVRFSIPAYPTPAANPSCVSMGPIGIANNGVYIFNGLDAGGRDAVAHEVQDSCGGHPERTGIYHYHNGSKCISGANSADTIVGYAFDGFPITSGMRTADGKYTNADLDECHGTTTMITIDGASKTMYHYVLTDEYPYTVGCFRGTNFVPRERDQDHENGTSTQGFPGHFGRPMGLGSPSMCNFSTSTLILKRGSFGAQVTALQEFLKSLGFLITPPATLPGYFGSLTEEAVKKYQRENGISPVGSFGPMTRGHFRKSCPPGLGGEDRGRGRGDDKDDDRDDKPPMMSTGTRPTDDDRHMGPPWMRNY